jgi:ribosome modulation factor
MEANFDFLENCWRSGYRAYEAKITKAKCPLAKGSPAREEWNAGWEQARCEYEETPPDEE